MARGRCESCAAEELWRRRGLPGPASRDGAPAVADALAALSHEDSQFVRLEAAYGLALRDDPRIAGAIERLGPLGPGFEHAHRADAIWRWRWRQEDGAATTPPAS
ncbi:hypothetical protein [Streptomyces herbicida]|uniref:hypothetical protein n=1 Tax=Streptomyces herbicida TaxID=3065675 RepID=UPI00292DDF92|nr:hypothetical protein [Streptomyces sp. NEAU-HV9]